MVVDGMIVVSATVIEPIEGGQFQVSSLSREEAASLAERFGLMPPSHLSWESPRCASRALRATRSAEHPIQLCSDASRASARSRIVTAARSDTPSACNSWRNLSRPLRRRYGQGVPSFRGLDAGDTLLGTGGV